MAGEYLRRNGSTKSKPTTCGAESPPLVKFPVKIPIPELGPWQGWAIRSLSLVVAEAGVSVCERERWRLF